MDSFEVVELIKVEQKTTRSKVEPGHFIASVMRRTSQQQMHLIGNVYSGRETVSKVNPLVELLLGSCKTGILEKTRYSKEISMNKTVRAIVNCFHIQPKQSGVT